MSYCSSQNLAVSNYRMDDASLQEMLKKGGAISAVYLI